MVFVAPHVVTDNMYTCKYYNIRKTCPRNIYPLIPHFYMQTLGDTGVYLFFASY